MARILTDARWEDSAVPRTLSGMTEPGTRRSGSVSFVRRNGRISSAQERAWSELASTYVVDVPRAVAQTSVHPDARLIPSEEYGREAPLIVEIGTGQGHAILHAAAAHPETDLLGVEVYRGGIARTMLEAEKAGLTNLRLIEANAPEVLATLLPEGSADEIRIFFPDPWHKKRHHKRRMISPGFGRLAGRALRDGGLLRLATDWEDYALQMREVLDDEPEFARAFEGDWADRFTGRPMTAFERKGIDKGREIRDLTYRRVER